MMTDVGGLRNCAMNDKASEFYLYNIKQPDKLPRENYADKQCGNIKYDLKEWITTYGEIILVFRDCSGSNKRNNFFIFSQT